MMRVMSLKFIRKREHFSNYSLDMYLQLIIISVSELQRVRDYKYMPEITAVACLGYLRGRKHKIKDSITQNLFMLFKITMKYFVTGFF